MGIMLEREGFTPVMAIDAHEALASLSSSPPDVIVVDLLMPGIDGVRLATILRQRSDTSRTPILMLSSLNDEDNVNRAMLAGASDYLHKPILHHHLIDKIRALMG